MTDDTMIDISMSLGTSELQQRWVPDAFGMVGEGRRIDRDRAGNITFISDWQSTGVAITAPLRHYTRYERLKIWLKDVMG